MDEYKLAKDLAYFEMIKILTQHISFKHEAFKPHRDAIMNLARDGEKEVYNLLKLIKGD